VYAQPYAVLRYFPFLVFHVASIFLSSAAMARWPPPYQVAFKKAF